MKKLSMVLAASCAALVFANNVNSGLNVGDGVTPFHPKHIAGPDKGTDTCPPCKYGARPAVQAWVSPSEKPEVLKALATTLSENVKEHKAVELKGFMIMLTMCAGCEGRAAKFAEGSKLENIGIATLGMDNAAVKAYKVNLEKDVKNTVIVYENKKVVAKFVNLTDSKEDLAKLEAAIDSAAK